MDTQTQSPEAPNAATRAPSFLDLRAFGAQAAATAGPARGDFLASRTVLLSSGAPSPVSALTLDAGEGRVDALPNDEFLIVVAGALRLSDAAGAHVLADGDAAVIPHGAAFAWSADAGTVAIVMTYADSQPSGAAITPITKNPPLEPSAKPAADILIGPAPDCRNFNDYRVDDGKFVCGTWDSTPYHRHGFLYGHHEIMHILTGSVTFSDENGRAQSFATGDVVLAERGSHCGWESREHVAKAFAIYRLG
ncbi:cupin domain-containing protein [Sphingobium sufflavum]|uniref:cupin domain-containing protein n=1 Tax=Sphingobium sufflavum TaxID=1129547 RepID=UPI001F4315DF|nr:cupin domain-containing protein [Sphingobium sufflavum]MCE7796244.1 cupin domain-containing protein [Sphingobium sufflavum]